MHYLISAIASFLVLCSLDLYAVHFNLQHEHEPSQLIIKIKPNFINDFNAVLKAFNGKIKHRFVSNGAFLVDFGASGEKLQELYSIAKKLSALLYVEYVEANSRVHIVDTIPNDPLFKESYGLHNTGQDGGKIGADIAAVKAWDIHTGSKNIKVGVVDTGIDYDHPDLKANIWFNPLEMGKDENGEDLATNGVDDDKNGYVDDYRGWNFVANNNDPKDNHDHGTHCAGIIGAKGQDGLGISGVNWNVSLVPLKFLDEKGSGSLEDAVKAIDYAVALGVDILSNSWGGPGFSETLRAAIENAKKAGVLFVAAAGNSGANNDVSAHYPSNYELDNVIAVTATTNLDQLAPFSNYGQAVHLGAPGAKIISTVRGGDYKKFSGTSMAAPFVSGVAALVKAAYPHYTYKDIRRKILNSVDSKEELFGKIQTNGRLNAYNAIENDTTPPDPVGLIKVVNTTISTADIEFMPSGDDGSLGLASQYYARISDKLENNLFPWDSASSVRLLPLAIANQYRMLDLPFNFHGYLSIAARDNAGNFSHPSQPIEFSVKKIQTYKTFAATHKENIRFEGSWGVEDLKGKDGHYLVFSDSPDGPYKNDINISMTLPALDVHVEDLVLSFSTYYHIETSFDYGIVEVSTDSGKNWKIMQMFDGEQRKWSTKILPFKDTIGSTKGKKIIVRFRIMTDYAVAKEGWLIDDIRLFGPSIDAASKF